MPGTEYKIFNLDNLNCLLQTLLISKHLKLSFGKELIKANVVLGSEYK